MADGLKIKCSTCGVDIDIAQLADHICAPEPLEKDDQQSIPPPLNRAATFGAVPSFNSSSNQPRGGRMPPPPMIDSNAANKPFYPQQAQLSPGSAYTDPRSNSPLSPGLGQRPFKMNRSATSPMPQKMAPSPELPANMDSSYPTFPNPRSGTPNSSRSKASEGPRPAYRHNYAAASPQYAPLSPRFGGGAAVAKRMDNIAPGPFDGSDRRPSTADGRNTPQQKAEFGHRRTATQGSVKSLNRASNPRASQVSSGSRTSSYSRTSQGLPLLPKPGLDGVPAMPPPPPRPPIAEEKPEGIDAFLDRLQKETMGPASQPRTTHSRQDSRSAIQPPSQQRNVPPLEAEKPMPRLPVFDAYGSAPRPNDEFPIRSTSRPGAKMPAPLNTQQPLLPPMPSNPVHTPSDSGQSDDSYSSAGFASVASSRSSPPASVASGSHSRGGSKSAFLRTDYTREEQIARVESPDSFLDPRPAPRPGRQNNSSSFDRSNLPPSLLVAPPPLFSPGPASPMDPAIHRGLDHKERKEARNLPRNDPALMTPPPIPESEPRQTPTRRPTAANKGKCRGCSQTIVGKSIKDSSGRLTGRYHNECFSCMTCGDPFPTADFYVFGNYPYCEHHYHELNGSLCRSCNRGIEGVYLETDARMKFHPKCFTCLTCRIVLRDDYFEVGGRPYCERHAFAAQRSNRSLFPGDNPNRNMQKRRTRLLMM